MEAVKKDRRRRTVLLTLTEACNLNCTYCYQDHKSQSRMSAQTGREAMERAFLNSPDHDEIEFDFFGGEPFLCFDLIAEICDWLVSERRARPYLVFISTNGTLVHGEIQKWLVSRKGLVFAGLSVDGTPSTQNLNRSGSYNDIDFGFFARHYPEQPVRMTVSPQRAGFLFEDILHLHGLGFLVTATFAHGVQWLPEQIAEVERQLKQLADHYLQHPGIKPCSLFGMNIKALSRKPFSEQRYCGTGRHMVSVTTDGQEYPCQMFQPNSMPAEYSAAALLLRDSDELFHDSECDGCVIDGICPTCYGMNLKMTGDVRRKAKDGCGIHRILARANAYYIAAGLEKGSLILPPAELIDTVKAVERLQVDMVER